MKYYKINQEFFGFNKKMKIESKIDFEASIKVPDVSKIYSDVEDLKQSIDVIGIFENEVCEFIGNYSDGFGPAFDTDSIYDGINIIKHDEGPGDYLELLKKLKIGKDFNLVKEIEQKHFEWYYDFDMGDKSVKYYSDCIDAAKESLKRGIANKEDVKYINGLKTYISLAEKEINNMKACLDFLKKTFRYSKN